MVPLTQSRPVKEEEYGALGTPMKEGTMDSEDEEVEVVEVVEIGD